MSTKLTGTVATITGASSGIGHATAVELARHGAAVALVARPKDRLDALVTEIEQAGGPGRSHRHHRPHRDMPRIDDKSARGRPHSSGV
jgi:NADP-dependent 3-hydroxy acid dehydrogenase YdfG